jgi:hypothetical protein
MTAMRTHKIARYVLVCGLTVLVLGVGVAVLRHNNAVEADLTQYDAALRQASAQTARFTVSCVQASLPSVRRSPNEGYTTVKTEVGHRIETGGPALHPDFTALASIGDHPVVARALRDGVRPRKTWVVALLVTQTTPGDAARLRLEVGRRSVNGFAVVTADNLFSTKKVDTERTVSVEWTPQVGETAFVPLAVLHQVEANQIGDPVLITSGVVLAPHRLFFDPGHGKGEVEIDIGPALHSIVLIAPPSS